MKRGNKSFLVTFSLVLAISFCLFPVITNAKALKYSSPYDDSNPMTTSMKWFGKELEKRTNGNYKAQFFLSGQMGKPSDLPELCKNQVVDFIFTGMGYTPNIFKLNRGFELMYITENPHANGAALWDLYHNYPPIKEEWGKNGLMMVFPAGIDLMACQATAPVNGIEDIKNKKLRSYAAVAEMIKIWGGTPIALSYAEIYDGLNRGLLNGAFGIPSVNLYDSRFWEVAPYVFNTGAGIYAVTYFAMSKKTYDSFPEDVKKIVDELGKEGMAHHRVWMEGKEKEVFAKLKEEKAVKVIDWSAEEKAKAKNMVVPQIWESWLSEMKKANLPGDEFLAKYKTLVEKYEKEYPYKNPYTY